MRVVVATGRFDVAAPVAGARHRGGRTAFGGAWEWTASLRYLMLLPLLAVIVGARRGLAPVLATLRAQPKRWLLWSTVGFGLFYAPLAFAVAAGPGWLLAGTWQITILAGILLAPVLYDDERAV